MLAMSFALLQR